MDTVQKQDKEYIAGTYARFPLTVEGGKGSVVWDLSLIHISEPTRH